PGAAILRTPRYAAYPRPASPSEHPSLRVKQRPQMRGIAAEAIGVDDREVARARQVDGDDIGDTARPRRHRNHPVGEKDRFRDRMGDEDHGLAALAPD